MTEHPSLQTARQARAAAKDRFAKFIRMDEVPEVLKDIRKMHKMTVYGWAMRGVAGVRLKAVCIGGIKCTTLDWLEEFWEAVHAAKVKKIVVKNLPAGGVSATPPVGPRSLVGHKESPAVTSILKEHGI